MTHPLSTIGMNDSTVAALAQVGPINMQNRRVAQKNGCSSVLNTNGEMIALIPGHAFNVADVFLGATECHTRGTSAPRRAEWSLEGYEPFREGCYNGLYVQGPLYLDEKLPGGLVRSHCVYVSWANYKHGLAPLSLSTEGDRWRVCPSETAYGLMIGQAQTKQGLKAHVILFGHSLNNRGKPGLIVTLSSVTVDITDPKNPLKAFEALSARSEHFNDLLKATLAGFTTYCQPSEGGAYWDTLMDAHVHEFTQGSNGDWQEDFNRIESPWELAAALRIWSKIIDDDKLTTEEKAKTLRRRYAIMVPPARRDYMMALWQLARHQI